MGRRWCSHDHYLHGQFTAIYYDDSRLYIKVNDKLVKSTRSRDYGSAQTIVRKQFIRFFNGAAMSSITELNEYQRMAGNTAIYPDIGNNPNYPIVKFAGEVGELLNKWGKVLRGDMTIDQARPLMIEELGDAFWYLSQIAYELGYSLSDVATININKLADRADRDVLRGSGDHR